MVVIPSGLCLFTSITLFNYNYKVISALNFDTLICRIIITMVICILLPLSFTLNAWYFVSLVDFQTVRWNLAYLNMLLPFTFNEYEWIRMAMIYVKDTSRLWMIVTRKQSLVKFLLRSPTYGVPTMEKHKSYLYDVPNEKFFYIN
jgi:hypothetical protein